MKTLGTILELIAALILVPLALLFRLAVILIFFAFLASPLILLGFIVWAVAT